VGRTTLDLRMSARTHIMVGVIAIPKVYSALHTEGENTNKMGAVPVVITRGWGGRAATPPRLLLQIRTLAGHPRSTAPMIHISNSAPSCVLELSAALVVWNRRACNNEWVAATATSFAASPQDRQLGRSGLPFLPCFPQWGDLLFSC